MTETHLSEQSFESLALTPLVHQGIQDCGFSKMTPIQAAIMPLVLKGRDTAGQAQTGTGKTAAFLIATFHHLLTNSPDSARRPNQPRALVLAPTRELAIQIHKDAQMLGKHTNLKMSLIYGGVDYDKQRQTLEQGVDILIGTPGRIIDFFKQHVFDLKRLEVLVLDEADRMFDLGFIKDIRFLLRRMPHPQQRLSMLFSATLSYRVMELAYEHMNNPQAIRIEPEQVTAERIRQEVYYPSNREKIPLLLGLMARKKPERSIVFTNTKRAAEEVSAYLSSNGYGNALLSGDVPQNKRQKLLKSFSEGELAVMVATDVAARGLHIPDVSHVFNYDLPQSPEDYVHRIGRTARAGAEGDAISFACEDTAFYLPEIESYIGIKIHAQVVESELLIEPEPPLRQERKRHPARSSGNRDRATNSNKVNEEKPRPKSAHRRRRKKTTNE